MLPKVIDARHAGRYRVWLRCADGLSGELDLTSELWGAMFEPLKVEASFSQLGVDPELDTIVWPTGAALSPQWLCDELMAQANTSAAQ